MIFCGFTIGLHIHKFHHDLLRSQPIQLKNSFLLFIFWLIFDLFLLFLWIDEDAWWCSTLVTIILAVLCSEFFFCHDCSVSFFFCYVLLFIRWNFSLVVRICTSFFLFFFCPDKTWSKPIFLKSILLFCWFMLKLYSNLCYPLYFKTKHIIFLLNSLVIVMVLREHGNSKIAREFFQCHCQILRIYFFLFTFIYPL